MAQKPTKTAVTATQQLAIELEKWIRINVVSPGVVKDSPNVLVTDARESLE